MLVWALLTVFFASDTHPLYSASCSDSLNRVWRYDMEKGEYADVVRSAVQVYSDCDTLSELSMYAAVMTGQAYGMLGIKDSMDLWLSRAFRAASLREDAWVLGAVYSSLASYTMDHEGNFYKSISYFMRGLEATEGNSPVYYTLKGNLALVYYLRNDYSGLKYAEDVLDYGLKTNNNSYIFHRLSHFRLFSACDAARRGGVEDHLTHSGQYRQYRQFLQSARDLYTLCRYSVQYWGEGGYCGKILPAGFGVYRQYR